MSVSGSDSNIKFSEIEKPGAYEYNDSGYLRKEMEKLKFEQPESFGGRFRDSSKKATSYPEFNTHTPPDITPNTRIIAVCGIIQEDATPRKDGWMLSDFFAFWHIFNGTTTHQTWLHCLDLESLVKKFGQYLHGNPYKERKIVLDETILEGAFKSRNPPLREKPLGFKLKVARKIREECSQAQARNENVLILLFGHGKLEHHGIHLGGGTAPNSELSKVFKFEDLQKNIAMNPKGSAVKVTVLTTHCYSGGWTCKPDANITTMTAAGDKNESTSWRASGSSGRYCGSMFASAIIEKMVRYGDQNKKLWQDLKEDPTEEQEETMATFGKSVYEILLSDVDRRGWEHCMTFGVQDDAWGMCWRERTGIPLADYGERWNKLTSCDPDKTLHPGDVQNRDPRVTQSVRDDYVTGRDKMLKSNSSSSGKKAHKVHEAKASVLGKRGRETEWLFGGTPEGLISVVSSLGAEYLASYGPRDDTGADGGLQDSIRRIQRGDEKDLVEVESALTTIEYRMNQMELADRYLKAMGIPAPRGLQCCMYNTSGLHDRMDSKKYETLQSMIFAHEVLFPDPMGNQGQPFYNGHHYLIAAFDAAGISKASVERKLEELAKMIDSELEDPKDEVKRDQEVVSKRRRVFQAFGFTPRDISPEKRRSRG